MASLAYVLIRRCRRRLQGKQLGHAVARLKFIFVAHGSDGSIVFSIVSKFFSRLTR